MENDLDSGRERQAALGRRSSRGFHDLFMQGSREAPRPTCTASRPGPRALGASSATSAGRRWPCSTTSAGSSWAVRSIPDCKNTMSRRTASGAEVGGHRDGLQVCEKCGKPMVIRDGQAAAASSHAPAFPSASPRRPSVDEEGKIVEPKKTGIPCEKCGSEMIVRGLEARDPSWRARPTPSVGTRSRSPTSCARSRGKRARSCEKCGSPDGPEDQPVGEGVPGLLGLSRVQERPGRHVPQPASTTPRQAIRARLRAGDPALRGDFSAPSRPRGATGADPSSGLSTRWETPPDSGVPGRPCQPRRGSTGRPLLCRATARPGVRAPLRASEAAEHAREAPHDVFWSPAWKSRRFEVDGYETVVALP